MWTETSYNFSNEINSISVQSENSDGNEFGIRNDVNVYENKGADASRHGTTGANSSAVYITVTEPSLLK